MSTFNPNHFKGRSQALRSVWCWYRPAGLLVDCGDGCTVDMGNSVGSPHVVALTHGHSDHILGLPNFLLARQLPSMVSGGPVTILYPEGTVQIDGLRTGIAAMWPRTVFDRITWVPMRSGSRFSIGPTREVVAFPTCHVENGHTLGYAVVESRFRLPAHLSGLSGAEIGRIAAEKGRAAVRERIEVPEFVHTGDTMPCEIPWMAGARVAIVDATFLDDTDRDAPTHATVSEAMEMSRGADHIVLHHLSQRYPRAGLVDAVRTRVEASGFDPARVTLWEDTDWTPLTP